jgi:hypothetical protein
MLVIFFGWQGVVHNEFVPQGRTVRFEFYREVMDRLLKRLRRVMPEKAQSGSWFLQDNNAPSHNATIDKQFLANKRVTVLCQRLTPQVWHLRTTFYSLK